MTASLAARSSPALYKVGLLATHPVQYYVPWYRALAQVTDLEVFYCQRPTPEQQGKVGFGIPFEWDVPLLDGYRHRFLTNRARRPDLSSFRGCDVPEIGRILQDERFDAFIVHGWAKKAYWQAMLAGWRTSTPIMVRGDSQLPMTRNWLRHLAKSVVYRLFVPRFDAYLVVGERAREYYLHYGADAGRMFFAPHAVDGPFFADAARSLRPARDGLRASWGIPAGAIVFLFAGKFVPKKRPWDFARALVGASSSTRRVWGLMVGDGPLRPALQATATAQGWPLHFAGFLNQTEMPKAYVASDALVLPSDGRETWGLVVNEAMACGLPAIVSDQVGCGPDLVRSSVSGEVFRCGDVDGLAAVLTRLADDPRRLAELGAGARQWVRGYSVERAVEGTLAALRAIEIQRSRPEQRVLVDADRPVS